MTLESFDKAGDIMKRSAALLLRCSIVAVSVLSLCGKAAGAADAEFDRMVAAGKSHRELAQYLFETRNCNSCHTIGREGKLGFTKKGEERVRCRGLKAASPL